MDDGLYPTKYWHQTSDGKILCDVCPRTCRLSEGQRGLCFVRQRCNNEIVLTTYGRSSGYCIDPIEKKPLNHFYPGTPVLSFGTAGCNLTCKFCQNWDISKSRDMDKLMDKATPRLIAESALKLNCKSVAFTYNDPVVFMEYAIDTAIECKKLGIKSVAVTAGYMNAEPRQEFYRHMDAANVDLKGFTEKFYREICGGGLKEVQDTIVYLKEHTSCWFELTTLLIPGKNDSQKETDEMTKWVVQYLGRDVPMHFTAFHPDWKMQDIPQTPLATLKTAQAIAMANGVRYAYTGNVHDEVGTYCHQCKKLLIKRDGYVITEWNLGVDTADAKNCSCGAPCAGFFESVPGNWGAKRLPVRLAG